MIIDDNLHDNYDHNSLSLLHLINSRALNSICSIGPARPLYRGSVASRKSIALQATVKSSHIYILVNIIFNSYIYINQYIYINYC